VIEEYPSGYDEMEAVLNQMKNEGKEEGEGGKLDRFSSHKTLQSVSFNPIHALNTNTINPRSSRRDVEMTEMDLDRIAN